MKFTREDYNKRIIDKEGKIPEDEPVFLLRRAGCPCTFHPPSLCKTAGGKREYGNGRGITDPCQTDGGMAEIRARAPAG